MQSLYKSGDAQELLSLLDEFKVTSEHVLIIEHCPLM